MRVESLPNYKICQKKDTSMYSNDTLQELTHRLKQWEQEASRQPGGGDEISTHSEIPVRLAYTPADLSDMEYLRDLGLPGEYPFTRGVHHTGYRGKVWTMRQFSGFGSAVESNARYKLLLEQGETGLSVAFDLPTLMGYDSDDPRALGEFGKCGVGISSLADMEILFDGIPVDDITTSMTINSPAAVIWAMYLVMAEKRGIPLAKLRGTIQNDILKEYTAQNEFIFPPGPSIRLVVDTIEYGTNHVPQWNTVSISGYHIREAGATAVQELAFTLGDGIAYVQAAVARGLNVDDFAPRLSFFFNVHNDFLEEIAKFRTARRLWAKVMKEHFNARNPRSWWLRFHAQTAGCTLTAQQPENNLIRTTIQALAAVLGGAQSLHTNAIDEALALPSEHAALEALRIQQIIAGESGVTSSVDPLGGSFMLEAMGNEMERRVYRYWEQVEAMGGIVSAIENGFFQREIANAAYRYQREIEIQQRRIVGINEFVIQENTPIPILEIDPDIERRHLERLNKVRRDRDNGAVEMSLKRLQDAAKGSENLMPYIMEAVKAYATLGEICEVMRGVFGEYKEESSWVAA